MYASILQDRILLKNNSLVNNQPMKSCEAEYKILKEKFHRTVFYSRVFFLRIYNYAFYFKSLVLVALLVSRNCVLLRFCTTNE